MDIQAVLQPTASYTPAATPIVVKIMQQNVSQWFLGQILNATVTSRKSTDTITLQIQNQLIEAKTNSESAINVGAQLKLVVAKQGNPIVLRVLQQDLPKTINEVKQQLLRESIPRQAGMEKLTSVLSQVLNNVKAAVNVLPTPIELQINKLIEHLPAKTNVNNEAGLKAAIKDSGLFLESKLMNEASSKVNLDRLSSTRRAPGSGPRP